MISQPRCGSPTTVVGCVNPMRCTEYKGHDGDHRNGRYHWSHAVPIDESRRAPRIEWTNDCQGKKNFDGSLVSVSTRYWPRGGGFSVLPPGEHEWQENDSRPHIRPAARVSIGFDFADDREELVKNYFEGESFEEVRDKVETWVEDHFRLIRIALRRAVLEW